jgi:hypothetical protein
MPIRYRPSGHFVLQHAVLVFNYKAAFEACHLPFIYRTLTFTSVTYIILKSNIYHSHLVFSLPSHLSDLPVRSHSLSSTRSPHVNTLFPYHHSVISLIFPLPYHQSDLKACHPPDPLLYNLISPITCLSFLKSSLYLVIYLILLSDLKACHPPDPLLYNLISPITCLSLL